jgi:hypothetical protein
MPVVLSRSVARYLIMLVALGHSVEFEIEGRAAHFKLPARTFMLLDPSGTNWSSTSVLFAPFKAKGTPMKKSSWMSAWFGGDYNASQGSIPREGFPSREMEGWREVGRALRIWYFRTGFRYPYPYTHPFKKKTGIIFGKEIETTLRRSGRFFRLDAPGGIKVSWRGILSP